MPGHRHFNGLKTALLLSKFGTLPAVAIMGKDHTMGALVDCQQGLSVGPDGRYRIPEGRSTSPKFLQRPGRALRC